MSTIKQLLTITGTVLIIASCQDANNESEIAALQQATVDTVPKGGTDTVPKRRTDTVGMGRMDTMGTGRTDTTGTGRYIDLSTGLPVELYYDPKTKRTYSSATNEPVDWYVNTATNDTIYGRGRYIVNNYIIRSEADNTYRLDAGKIKIDKDEIKIKDGNKKFKMDKSEMKMKGGDMKSKVDTTGMKIKSGDMKKKTGEGESKTKY